MIGRELRSTIDQAGRLTLSLDTVEPPAPGDDEILVRIEAAPINPSDLAQLLGPADLAPLVIGEATPTALVLTVPPERLASAHGRIGQSLTAGNEGAGLVVAAGANAQALLGKRVGLLAGAMYADYRTIRASDAIPLPADTPAADGAAMFVNPLTALGFVETMKREGHKAIVHTAAASNLGQMLQKICRADGIALVNIVRSPEQADILRAIGAEHVLDSRAPDFVERLTEAVDETGATIAFDAIGGGPLGDTILLAMERAAVARMSQYNRYGSSVFKQLYIYGLLDPAPSTIDRLRLGFQWSAGGWLLTPFLRSVTPDIVARMRQRVVDELTTTFASHYTRTIGLAELLEPEVLRACQRKATAEKYLIDPTRG
jgi:NADPH2:quinone reductase